MSYANEATGDTLLHIMAKSAKDDAITAWMETHIGSVDVNAVDVDGRCGLLSNAS